MQSGRGNTDLWVLEYEPEIPLKVDPLMGYTSSSDMRRQIRRVSQQQAGLRGRRAGAEAKRKHKRAGQAACAMIHESQCSRYSSAILPIRNNVDIPGDFEHQKNNQGDDQDIATGRGFIDALVDLRNLDIGHRRDTGSRFSLIDTSLQQTCMDPVALAGNVHELVRKAGLLKLSGRNHTRLGWQTSGH